MRTKRHSNVLAIGDTVSTISAWWHISLGIQSSTGTMMSDMTCTKFGRASSRSGPRSMTVLSASVSKYFRSLLQHIKSSCRTMIHFSASEADSKASIKSPLVSSQPAPDPMCCPLGLGVPAKSHFTGVLVDILGTLGAESIVVQIWCFLGSFDMASSQMTPMSFFCLPCMFPTYARISSKRPCSDVDGIRDTFEEHECAMYVRAGKVSSEMPISSTRPLSRFSGQFCDILGINPLTNSYFTQTYCEPLQNTSLPV